MTRAPPGVASNWSPSQQGTSGPYFIGVQFCIGMWRGQQTKLRSHPDPIFLLTPPQGLKSILTHEGREHISENRYRTYFDVGFQSSPHRVDDRGYFKEKRQGGVFKSEEDIKKIHEGEKAPLRQEQFSTFPEVKYALLYGGWVNKNAILKFGST